jgi:hypothetical protein
LFISDYQAIISMMNTINGLCLLILIMFPISIPAEGTEALYSGSISGAVTDQSGNPLIGATVMANKETDTTPRAAMTDASGHYFITSVPPGTYSVIAMMVGMTPDTVFDVRLAADDSLTINFALDPARLRPVFVHPMIDTVFTGEIFQTEWSSTHNWNSRGIADTVSKYASVESIDRRSHPGELRLELEEHCILDTCTNFRMLQSYDLNRDGSLDILGISIEGDQRWTYHSGLSVLIIPPRFIL